MKPTGTAALNCIKQLLPNLAASGLWDMLKPLAFELFGPSGSLFISPVAALACVGAHIGLHRVGKRNSDEDEICDWKAGLTILRHESTNANQELVRLGFQLDESIDEVRRRLTQLDRAVASVVELLKEGLENLDARLEEHFRQNRDHLDTFRFCVWRNFEELKPYIAALHRGREEVKQYFNEFGEAILALREDVRKIARWTEEYCPRGQPTHHRNNFAAAKLVKNRLFTDRDDELTRLHEKMKAGSIAITHALSGEGGVGKTELAKAYALRYDDEYDGVWWVDASETGLNTSIALLFEVITGQPPPQRAELTALCQCLHNHFQRGRHLVILDNVESAERFNTFAGGDKPRILATTRLRLTRAAAVEALSVNVLTEDAALALMVKQCERRPSTLVEADLRSIVKELGCHTLAVTLAGSYLAQYGDVGAAELHAKLRNEIRAAKLHSAKSPIFRKKGKRHDPLGLKYEHSVHSCLSLHFRKFDGKQEMEILWLAAFCYPVAIPVGLLARAADVELDTARRQLSALAEVSILQYGEAVSIHRLTQSIARGMLADNDRRARLQLLVNTLRPDFEDAQTPKGWKLQAMLAPHCAAVISHAADVGDVEGAGKLGNQLGIYLINTARYAEAKACLQDAETLERARYGDHAAEVASVLLNKGVLLKHLGDLAGALRVYREAEQIERTVVGDNDALGTVLNNIGAVLAENGDPIGALSTYREAERIYRATIGSDHPDFATLLNNIGNLLAEKGDLAGALDALREAERIDRAALGGDHPQVAIRLSNIGMALLDGDDLEEALDAFQEAEAIDRAAFGSEHPDVAIRVNNIGKVLQARGELVKALEKYREAERIWCAKLGDDHPNVATAAANIGSVLHDQGDLVGAMDKYCEAERIDRAALGNNHPKIAVRVTDIGSVLEDQHDLVGAVAKYREAERIDRAVFGDNHQRVAVDLARVGRALMRQSNFAWAIETLCEGERIFRAAVGDNHPNVAAIVNDIGQLLQRQGDLAGAGAKYLEAFGIYLEAQGPCAINTMTVAENLTDLSINAITKARQIVGDDAAAQLAQALTERHGAWPPPAHASQ